MTSIELKTGSFPRVKQEYRTPSREECIETAEKRMVLCWRAWEPYFTTVRDLMLAGFGLSLILNSMS